MVGPAPAVLLPEAQRTVAVFSSCVRVNLQNQDAENIFVITGPPDLRSGPVPGGIQVRGWQGLSGWGQVLRAPRTVENSIPPLSGGRRAVCLELPREAHVRPARARPRSVGPAPRAWAPAGDRGGPPPAARGGTPGPGLWAPSVSRLFSRAPSPPQARERATGGARERS